ncbi:MULTISPECIES: glutamine--fructose-6-phosphate transaminase (isomerizing) [Lentibacter]|jgi:glucosamine--fructose-6-phosphate aminotransferase (isomerizing)|uniref:Glutamine--fructose-6-phosphate aminotransferase [isomerizing] n=2 Tax=Lentibacter algarum TaxID=576131 RepID=A0A1H3ICL3_9RHOB|nr:glutamine--fructose-6-phosphate transaminase (isomerizing) [Lentibacter algarum]MCO4829015.1 glutamine--fructose-6-phosphate transaminase (isomerizing) [Lentibacter algarum]WIF31435.1 glucosamine--fructose-6-phosphate aminotransferase GlmS [Lentibacter algarum]SDY25367.1 glucosamine--fructose-6-phosphate aminotransferase (isomerizing) [Lentibacter algarum]
MCGIVGVLGEHEAAPLLVESLKRLEYRGYDSAGIATVDKGRLGRRRAVGKLVNLSDRLVHEPLTGKAGIGHTRWATHGAPNENNAHPHSTRQVAVVHNGIIENYRELREELAAKGIGYETDTDTETVALLTQAYLDEGQSPREAALSTVSRLTGAYALCFLFEGEEDLLIAARQGSPLAIGYGSGEMFVGSDAIALAPLTDQITYLEEGDFAFVTRTQVEILDAARRPANREIKTVEIETGQIDKGGYKHFMSKEIAEQPRVLTEVIGYYLSDDATRINLPENGFDFKTIDRLTMVACGTAFYACLTAKYWFEQIAGMPVEVDIASEFRYREPPITERTAALFVSQSGETADTLAALRYCEGKADSILSVVNVPTSSIARESNLALPIMAGPEIGVASTKAFTCQLTVLYLMALKAAHDKGRLSDTELADRLSELRSLPSAVNAALALDKSLAHAGLKLSEAQDVLFLGRGLMYPLALEGALKLKEISYIHAEAYASGELKHGPIALIDKSMPVVVKAPRDALFEKTVSNMQEVMARDGKVILITDAAGAAEAGDEAWITIVMPTAPAALTPILYAIPAQLLAYHTAVAKGTDVDQPRNLAKSVTVE